MPGGTQLLSKRSELFLPEGWPSYVKKAKGVEVWDLDGNKFIDMSIMGVGGCILGYANSEVNRAVKNVIDAGSMNTLNSPEEVELATLLLSLHPWAGMVRYARSGGEAVTIAVRIARAYSGKDKVAFCGYHGWHDWYLAANLANDKNLDGQLLPGLKPKGVPRGLKGTAIPFSYNDMDELLAIVKDKEVGTIVMEPVREHEPENGFLSRVREIATRNDIVLVFDEITSGWRTRVGGIYANYNVEPDVVVYAKAMSNGFPMAAVVGRRKVMDAAEESFISSTSWTDRIGPAAALATIKTLKTKNVPKHLIAMGNKLFAGWKKLAHKHGVALHTYGIAPLASFGFDYGKDSQALHTLFTQEMLKHGFLASKSVYISYAHKASHVQRYFKAVDEVFAFLAKAIKEGRVRSLLKGPVAHTGFRRLT